MNEKKDPKNVLDLKPIQRTGGRLPHSKIAQFTPDEDLIQSTSRIKSQRDIILERVKRMQTSQGRVSNSVFDKVKRDYGLQMDTINELLDDKKKLLKDEIRKLYMIREKLTVEVNRHKEILEEADFRHFLGEFTQAQYQEVENFETKEIEKAESDLSHVSQWIRIHEELFDPHDFSPKTPDYPPLPSQQSVTQNTQTAYKKPAQESPEVFTPKRSTAPESQPAAPQKVEAPAPTTPDLSHLFHDTDSQIEKLDPQNNQPLESLEHLIEAVQASAGEVDFLAEQKTKTPPVKTEEKNYFENSEVNESSFKIESIDLASPDASGGESVTLAKPMADLASKPAKEDSISDILESIHLEGEDELINTNSALPKQEQAADYKLKLTEGDLDDHEFLLKANTSIGRSPSNDVVLKEPKVSRQHAAINLYNDSYILVDLKSSNGVYVNGTKIDETVLHAGDEISIGGYKFIFMKND